MGSRMGKYIPEVDNELRSRVIDLIRGEDLGTTLYYRKVLAHEAVKSAKHLGIQPWGSGKSRAETSCMTSIRNLMQKRTSMSADSRLALVHALDRLAGVTPQVEASPVPDYSVSGVDTTRVAFVPRDSSDVEEMIFAALLAHDWRGIISLAYAEIKRGA